MFRRTMIILISVLAMVFLGLLLHRLPQLNYERVVGLFKVDPEEVADASAGSMEVGQTGTSLAESDFEIIVRDPDTNRLRYVIRARKMAPEVGTTRTLLTEPDFYIYDADGEVVNVKAPQGHFDTSGGPLDEYDDITRGRLSGGVVLRHDRGTPDDPTDDIVATMDHVDYVRVATMEEAAKENIPEGQPADDRPVSRLSTEDHVTIRSPEADVDADGMVIYLVRGKSDLRQVWLLDQVHIILRTGSDRFDVGLVGDVEATDTAATPVPRPGGRTAPTTSGATASTGRAGTAPATGPAKRPASSTAGAGQSGSTASAAGATVAEAGTDATKQAVDQSLMHFLLVKNVRINQGDRHLEGDRVTLLMPEDSGSKKSDDKSPSASQTLPPKTTAPTTRSNGSPASTTPRTTTSATSPRNGNAASNARAESPSSAARDDAADENTPAVPVDIVCDGPFVLTPRQVRMPQVEFHVTATGSPVVLTDKDMEARGEYFEYDGTSKQGNLRGSASHEARVVQDESTVTGEQFTFDQDAGTARVDGRGHFEGKQSGSGLGMMGGKAQDTGDEPFHARWDDWMSVSYVSRDVEVDGKSASKSFIRVADFSGKAVLWQGSQTLAGNEIHVDFFLPNAAGKQGLLRLTADGHVAASQPEVKESMPLGDLACEHLDVDFVRLPDGDSRVAAMYASGKVKGSGHDRQAKAGDIEADELWVTFAEDPEDPTSAKVQTMTAKTDVRVRQEGYYAESDTLKMTEGGERIELNGTAEQLALVSSGTNKLRGQKIVALQSAKRTDVTGAGSLNLLSTRGLEGEKLDEPMPLHITWTESMFFDGLKNQAHFMGDAKARTPSASIDCRDLWVFFTDRPEKAKEAGQQSDTGEDDASKLFGSKDLLRLTAIENVVARTITTPDDPTKGLNVSTLECDKLEYNAEKSKAFVPGPGVLTVIEVDRVPAVKPPHERKPRNSTRVTWKKEMIFEQQRAVAYFGEDVVARVVGRSLGMIKESKDVGQLSGTSTLWCQDLRLFFVQDGAEKKTSGLGTQLQQLVASEKVSFKDGDYHARGERMTYDVAQELLVLTRSQAQPAAIWVQNEQKQVFDHWGGDKLYYYRTTREVKAVGPRDITITPRDTGAFD